MDVMLGTLALLLGIILGITTLSVASEGGFAKDHAHRTGAFLILLSFLFCVFTFTMTIVANIYHNPETTVKHYDFIVAENVVCYNKNGTVVQVTGNERFVDTKNTVVCHTVKHGGWWWGIYVTGSETIEFVKRDSVEKKD